MAGVRQARTSADPHVDPDGMGFGWAADLSSASWPNTSDRVSRWRSLTNTRKHRTAVARLEVANGCKGSTVPVRDMRMQPFALDFATVVHCRQRAAAIGEFGFFVDVAKRQVPRVDQPFAKRIAKGGFRPPPSVRSQISMAAPSLLSSFVCQYRLCSDC